MAGNISLKRVIERKLLVPGRHEILPPATAHADVRDTPGVLTDKGLILFHDANQNIVNARTPRVFLLKGLGQHKERMSADQAWQSCRYRDTQAENQPIASLGDIYTKFHAALPERSSFGPTAAAGESDDEDDGVSYLLPTPPPVLATVEARYDEASAPVPDFSGAAEPLCDVLAEALWPGDRESSDALRKFVVFQLTQECKNESFYDECLRDAFQPRNDQDRASGQKAARHAFLRYREGHAGRLPPIAAVLNVVRRHLPVRIIVYDTAGRVVHSGESELDTVRDVVFQDQGHGRAIGRVRRAQAPPAQAPAPAPMQYDPRSTPRRDHYGVSIVTRDGTPHICIGGGRLILAQPGQWAEHPTDEDVRRVVLGSGDGGAIDVYFEYKSDPHPVLVTTLNPLATPPPPPLPPSTRQQQDELDTLNEANLQCFALAASTQMAALDTRMADANARAAALLRAKTANCIFVGFTKAGKSTLISDLLVSDLRSMSFERANEPSRWRIVPSAPRVEAALEELLDAQLSGAREEIDDRFGNSGIAPSGNVDRTTNLETKYVHKSEPEVAIEWSDPDKIRGIFAAAKKIVTDFAADRETNAAKLKADEYEYDASTLAHAVHLVKSEEEDDSSSDSGSDSGSDSDDNCVTREEEHLSMAATAFEIPPALKALEGVLGKRTTRVFRGHNWPAIEKDIRELLIVFTTGSNSWWPVWAYIKSVTVGLPAELLKHVTLADVPGFESEEFRDEQIKGASADYDCAVHVVGTEKTPADMWTGLKRTHVVSKTLDDSEAHPVVIVIPKDKAAGGPLSDSGAKRALKARKREWRDELAKAATGEVSDMNFHRAVTTRQDTTQLRDKLLQLAKLNRERRLQTVVERLRDDLLEVKNSAQQLGTDCARFAGDRFRDEGGNPHPTLVDGEKYLRSVWRTVFCDVDDNFLHENGDNIKKLKSQVVEPLQERCTPDWLEKAADPQTDRTYLYLKKRSRTLGRDINSARPLERKIFPFLLSPFVQDLSSSLVAPLKLNDSESLIGGIVKREIDTIRDNIKSCADKFTALGDAADPLARVVLQYATQRLNQAGSRGERKARMAFRTWRSKGIFDELNRDWKRSLEQTLRAAKNVRSSSSTSINRARMDLLKQEEEDLAKRATEAVMTSVRRCVQNVLLELRSDAKTELKKILDELKVAGQEGRSPPGLQTFACTFAKRPRDFDTRLAAAIGRVDALRRPAQARTRPRAEDESPAAGVAKRRRGGST